MTPLWSTIRAMCASRRVEQRVQNLLLHIILILGAVFVMVPLVWMLSTSLKPPDQVKVWPPTWIPRPFVWSNYVRALTIFPVPFYIFVRNSVFLSAFVTLGTVMSNAVFGFVFARLRFRGSAALFLLVLSTMMLPQQVTLIPLFLLFSRIGWVNSYKPLIVPAFFGDAYFVFLLRQFFTTIPRELDDAARIDGCGILSLFFRIDLPLVRPALGITAIFSFTWAWNNFIGPLIYLSKMETFPLTIALSYLSGTYRILWSELMVVSFIAMLPPLLLFLVAQKYYIQGIVISGVKG